MLSAADREIMRIVFLLEHSSEAEDIAEDNKAVREFMEDRIAKQDDNFFYWLHVVTKNQGGDSGNLPPTAERWVRIAEEVGGLSK